MLIVELVQKLNTIVNCYKIWIWKQQITF